MRRQDSLDPTPRCGVGRARDKKEEGTRDRAY